MSHSQYRIPLKAQKARALGLTPQGPSRLKALRGPHALRGFERREKRKTQMEGKKEKKKERKRREKKEETKKKGRGKMGG